MFLCLLFESLFKRLSLLFSYFLCGLQTCVPVLSAGSRSHRSAGSAWPTEAMSVTV